MRLFEGDLERDPLAGDVHLQPLAVGREQAHVAAVAERDRVQVITQVGLQ
jgi:hypothetical protein